MGFWSPINLKRKSRKSSRGHYKDNRSITEQIRDAKELWTHLKRMIKEKMSVKEIQKMRADSYIDFRRRNYK